jgi:PAS domain S-box-containing protein
MMKIDPSQSERDSQSDNNNAYMRQQNNAYIHNVFMQTPVAIRILKGKDYILEFANDYYLDMMNRGKDIIGKPFFQTFPALHSQEFKEIFDNILDTGLPFYAHEYEFNLERGKKHKQGFFNFVYQPLREFDGTVIGIIVAMTEVTEQVLARKKVEESEKRYNMMLMQSPFGFAILKGENMVVSLANDSIKGVWGKGNAIEAKSLFDILPEIKDQGFPELLNNVYTTGIPFYGDEMPVKLLRGGKMEDVYFNFIYQPYYEVDETISGVTIIAYEVTTQVNTHKAIAESEKRMRLVADLMPEKITHTNSQGKAIFYNQNWLNYTGLSLDELKTYNWENIIHPEDLIKAQNNWAQCLETGNNFEMEVRVLDKKGAYNWHLSRVKSVKDSDGKIIQWIGVNTEIQQQKEQTAALEWAVDNRTKELLEANQDLQQKNKEIEETRNKLSSEYARSLVEASLDPLLVINPKGRITDMNQAAIQVIDKTRQALTGTHFFDYFTEPQKAKDIYEEVFLKGFVANYPLTIKDHKLTDVLFNGSVYKDENGKVLGAVIVTRDITEQKRIQKELIEAKIFAELAAKIAEEAKIKAEEATLIAENAVKAKQQFLSNMSHEIRTPMNAIIGFTKVMLKTELTGKQKEYLTAVKMSGDSLIVLINDILDLAKVDAGKMTFERTPFKLALSISAMLHLFEIKIQEKNLVLIKEYDKRIPDVLLGDPVRLHQIILNLVSNAVKFTSKGHIKVSIKLIHEDKEKVTIQFSVHDTGIGITENKMATIFDNFQQAAQDTPRLYGGTGLGLAIVKQLVEPQGGTISVKSKITEGSTFSFILDFEKTTEEAEFETEIMELDPDVKNIKVLVVEDMALNQLLMKTILDDFGFDRDIADNGKIAIEKLMQKNPFGIVKPYDVILMDLQMPEMNGFEATEYIRNTLKSKIPIIALTADVTTVDLAKCKAVGMNDYIAKPVDERLLYSKIVNLVKKAVITKANEDIELGAVVKLRCTNLNYLMQRTKSNPTLMAAMIDAYLEQTPPLIQAMTQSFKDKNWDVLHSAVHKMMPSFMIMGISNDVETMAKKVMEYARKQEEEDSVFTIVAQLDTICTQACEELKEELNKFKNSSKLKTQS